MKATTTANRTHRTYSRSDLNKTGQPDTAGAIEAVNPDGRIIALRLIPNGESRIHLSGIALSDRSFLFYSPSERLLLCAARVMHRGGVTQFAAARGRLV